MNGIGNETGTGLQQPCGFRIEEIRSAAYFVDRPVCDVITDYPCEWIRIGFRLFSIEDLGPPDHVMEDKAAPDSGAAILSMRIDIVDFFDFKRRNITVF